MDQRPEATASSPSTPVQPNLASGGPENRAVTPQNGSSEQPTTAGVDGTPPPRARWRSPWRAFKEFMGYAGASESERRARRRRVSLAIFLFSAFAQIALVTILTVLTAIVKSDQPNHPGDSQFDSCSDLAILNLIWLGRVVVVVYLLFWARWIKRVLSRRRLRQEAAQQTAAAPPLNAQGDIDLEAAAVQDDPAHPAVLEYICPMNVIAMHVLLIKLSPALTLVWFVTGVLLVIQRAPHCRTAAPGVIALTATLLLIIYIRFVIHLLLSLIRIILTRRRSGRPSIGKLSQAEVDRIPLVLYIPPPPGDTSPTTSPAPAKPILSPSTTYPPALQKQPRTAPSKKKKRFIAFRPKGTRMAARTVEDDVEEGVVQHSVGAVSALALVNSWDAMWAPAPYPLVRLPENKATCMICLCEFEEPRKLGEGSAVPVTAHEHAGQREEEEVTAVPPLSPVEGQPPGTIEEVLVEPPRVADAQAVEMAHEEGEEALQPLRLLSCGHAYHKECIDPWLTQKSGRCPYCQTRVEIPPPPKDRRKWWRWRRG